MAILYFDSNTYQVLGVIHISGDAPSREGGSDQRGTLTREFTQPNSCLYQNRYIAVIQVFSVKLHTWPDMNLPDLTDRLHGKIALHTIVKTAGTIQHRATLDHSGIPYPDAILYHNGTLSSQYRNYETHAAAPHTHTHFHMMWATF